MQPLSAISGGSLVPQKTTIPNGQTVPTISEVLPLERRLLHFRALQT